MDNESKQTAKLSFILWMPRIVRHVEEMVYAIVIVCVRRVVVVVCSVYNKMPFWKEEAMGQQRIIHHKRTSDVFESVCAAATRAVRLESGFKQ